jgi:hypothetical protein
MDAGGGGPTRRRRYLGYRLQQPGVMGHSPAHVHEHR